MYIIDAYLNRLHRTFYGLNEYSVQTTLQISLQNVDLHVE